MTSSATTAPPRATRPPAPRSLLARLARGSIRHRWLVIAGWILLVGLAVGGNRLAGGSFVNDLSVSGADGG